MKPPERRQWQSAERGGDPLWLRLRRIVDRLRNDQSPSLGLRRHAFAATFTFWQRFGLHVLPNDFYAPIPDTRRLREAVWEPKTELPGIEMNEASQLDLLRLLHESYGDEYAAFPEMPVPSGYYLRNPMFGCVDAEILYAIVRHTRPNRVVEIGSGYSTLLLAQALERNAAEDAGGQLTAIEPFPTRFLKSFHRETLRLDARPVQDVPLSDFTSLRAGDVLFIDSSHVLHIDSDVRFEYLEILPRLAAGVLVHLHDIFLPAEYPRDWVLRKKRFWTEQYLLQALLTDSDGFEVVWAANFMHLRHPDVLEATIPSYDRNHCRPGSFWLRRAR